MSPDLKLAAIHGSPRRNGHSSQLLAAAIKGARTAGACVEELFPDALCIAPCREDYSCTQNGHCVIGDDFQHIAALFEQCHGLLVASPIFFGTVPAPLKLLIDRCQCFWIRKYRLHETGPHRRPALIIVTAARRETPQLFEGVLRPLRYFCDALDMVVQNSCCYGTLEENDDIRKDPQRLETAFAAGVKLAQIAERNR
ncbi:MAG: flavodoxin family protein [Deltaproteobacteria bacterium]|nr:flavodoxin family protein [Deltaproteobacteria bacterium]